MLALSDLPSEPSQKRRQKLTCRWWLGSVEMKEGGRCNLGCRSNFRSWMQVATATVVAPVRSGFSASFVSPQQGHNNVKGGEEREEDEEEDKGGDGERDEEVGEVGV